MHKKEYLAYIDQYINVNGTGPARHVFAQYFGISLGFTSRKLSALKKMGLVHNVQWPDGSKVWLLTESGYNRLEYFRAREQRGQ